MFHGKKKAITFSFDDGTEQDIRLIKILNKYGLKATFNINSGLLGYRRNIVREGVTVAHNRLPKEELRSVYDGHEVASHTLNHCRLPDIQPDCEVIRLVECDRVNLEEIMQYEVVGMAYSCGGTNYDQRTAELIRGFTGIKYARTVSSNHSFDLQTDLFQFHPTVHFYSDWAMMQTLMERFLNLGTECLQIMYIWGHSFEFDIHNTWNRFEEFCKYISGQPDIFYGTNREVLLKKDG